MDRLFDLVFVRPPPNSYVNCVSANPERTKIDVALAKEQHRQYVSILKQAGVIVMELRPLEDFPDSVFMQDPALLGSRSSVIGRFGEEARRGEEKILASELGDYRSHVGKMCFVRAPGTLEGGDVVVTDRGIFAGESRRTNLNGIRQLATHFGLKVTPVKTELMHLLCGCSYLANGKMIVALDLVHRDSFPGFEFIAIPAEESYAADALYIGEGRVIIPAGFSKTSEKLKRAGFKPIEAEMSEFYKGDGGVTCLSSPIYKLF